MSDELIPEVVEEAVEAAERKPKPRRKKEELIVVEHDGLGEESPLYKCLDEAAKNLARDGTLIVSVPKELAGDVLSSWLLAHGFELTSLNVLTNPHIKERRGRSGWICRPRS